MPGQRRGGPNADIGAVALHYQSERSLRVVVHERVDREQAHVAVGVREYLQEHLLRGLRVLLDKPLDRELARVGVARAERGFENADFLVLLRGELERFLPQPRVRVVEELVQERRRPLFLFLGSHFGERFAAHVRVNRPEREPQRVRSAAGDLEVENRLERLAANALRAVVERANEQIPARFSSRAGLLFLDRLDERFEAAAAHVLVRGREAGLGNR